MKYLIALIVIIMSFQAFIYWPVRTSPACAKYEWKSQEEKKEFHRLLKKHGLHKQVSVIFNDGKREFYINERKQKCPFI
jgi:hypothetical protein